MKEQGRSAGLAHHSSAPLVPAARDGAGADDGRTVYRIAIDVLAVPAQIEALRVVLGTAICGRPDDHAGPCRLAWRMTVAGPDRAATVPPPVESSARASLAALEAWPEQRATADLIAEAEVVHEPAGRRSASPNRSPAP